MGFDQCHPPNRQLCHPVPKEKHCSNWQNDQLMQVDLVIGYLLEHDQEDH